MRGWTKAEQMKKTRSTDCKHLSELSRCLKEVASCWTSSLQFTENPQSYFWQFVEWKWSSAEGGWSSGEADSPRNKPSEPGLKLRSATGLL